MAGNGMGRPPQAAGAGAAKRAQRAITSRLFSTDRTPNVPLTMEPAVCLSPAALTAPVRVTWPRSTMMWMDGCRRRPYRSRNGCR